MAGENASSISLVQGMAFGESRSKAVGMSEGLLKAYSTLYSGLLELGFSHDHVRTALTALPMVSPAVYRVKHAVGISQQ